MVYKLQGHGFFESYHTNHGLAASSEFPSARLPFVALVLPETDERFGVRSETIAPSPQPLVNIRCP